MRIYVSIFLICFCVYHASAQVTLDKHEELNQEALQFWWVGLIESDTLTFGPRWKQNTMLPKSPETAYQVPLVAALTSGKNGYSIPIEVVVY